VKPPRNEPKIKLITNPSLRRSRVGHLTQPIPMRAHNSLIPQCYLFGPRDALRQILVP